MTKYEIAQYLARIPEKKLDVIEQMIHGDWDSEEICAIADIDPDILEALDDDRTLFKSGALALENEALKDAAQLHRERMARLEYILERHGIEVKWEENNPDPIVNRNLARRPF